MKIGGFDWDNGNWPKCGKHGLSKSQIESIFDGDVRVLDDSSDRDEEHRYRGIGKDGDDRYTFIVFCLRRKNRLTLLRPVSARYMHAKEVRHLEQQKA
ncbi:BrnT family toxin [Rhizobium tubonense]|uniref:BrnT family toxin n=1 Tax=Rhizobium tubonense TaxID=484088 RepID=A0A2W4C1X4_9HYPH|nr:BrnT family toxin [Rhizobium tubonense]PZM07662.1 hypothetical protein CPY51_31570 [Rhizobium tubonense]